jgi:hypothetical protein
MTASDIITLGIGPESDIPTLLTFGLDIGSGFPAFTTPTLEAILTISRSRTTDLEIQNEKSGTVTIKRTYPGKVNYHG